MVSVNILSLIMMIIIYYIVYFLVEYSFKQSLNEWEQEQRYRMIRDYNIHCKIQKSINNLKKLATQLIVKPVEEPIDEPVEEPIAEPVEEPVEEPVKESVEESIDEPIKESVEEPIDEPMEKTVVGPFETGFIATVENFDKYYGYWKKVNYYEQRLATRKKNMKHNTQLITAFVSSVINSIIVW